MISTFRCVMCGHPVCDHWSILDVAEALLDKWSGAPRDDLPPLRYVARAWFAHRFWSVYRLIRGH